MIGTRTLLGRSSHVDESIVPPPGAGRPINFESQTVAAPFF